jgi:hypothetical protein
MRATFQISKRRQEPAMRPKAATLAIVLVIAAACGGSGTATQGTGGSSPGAPLVSFGPAASTKLPFGGDVCKSLTAADLAAVATGGYTLASTKVSDGLGGPNSQCVYHLTNPNGGFTEPGVSYNPPSDWDFDKSQAQKDSSFQQLTGIGDDAYSSESLGQLILSLKAKGYYVQISGVDVGGFNKLDALKSLATALVGRLQ